MSDEHGNQDHPSSETDKLNSEEEKKNAPAPAPAQVAGVRQGNEMAQDGDKEAGRFSMGTTGADRPAGGSTSRDSTGISDEDPIDPESVSTPSA